MRCPCHGASGRCGTDDIARLGKLSIELQSYFQANPVVPIDGDVATGSRLLRTHCVPEQPTALRHDARKLGRVRLASDDSKGTLSSWSSRTAGDVKGLFLIRLSWRWLLRSVAAFLHIATPISSASRDLIRSSSSHRR
jgi:hypothetical protein